MMKAVDYVGEHGNILERQQCRSAIATAIFGSRSIFDINNRFAANYRHDHGNPMRANSETARILGRLEAMRNIYITTANYIYGGSCSLQSMIKRASEDKETALRWAQELINDSDHVFDFVEVHEISKFAGELQFVRIANFQQKE